MPVDPSIALQTQQPDPKNFISGFLDLGQKKLNLDKSRETYASDVAQSKANSSRAQSAATVDAASVQPAIAQNAAVSQSAQTASDAAKFHLQGEQAQMGRQIAASFIQDPDFVNGNSDAMIDKIIQARATMVQNGVPPKLAEANTAQLITMAVNKPGEVKQALANIIQQGQGAQGQAAQSLVPAGGQQQVVGTDIRGNPIQQNRNQFGDVTQSGVVQGAPGQQVPQRTPTPLVIPPGENQQSYKLLNDEREALRTTVVAAPAVHALNHEILSELDKATTGQYSGIIAKGQSIAGMLGLSLTGANDAERAASAYDLVDKYTTMAATKAAQSMGNDTATALNAQLKQNASVERNPTAIKKSIKFNDAILSGSEAYQGGLESSIKNNPQQDIFVKRQFDQQWAKNFDPVIMQIYNAKKSGDTAELADLVKGLGGKKDEIMRKAQNLQRLSTQGL